MGGKAEDCGEREMEQQLERLSDEELYQYYLELEQDDNDEAVQEMIEKMPRFEAYVRDRDYTVWRRTQDWYRAID